jgi:hypothetical protein
MNLRIIIQTAMCAALVLANGEQLSSATTLTSDLKVSLIIADHCAISTETSTPSVRCDGSNVYRVYENAPSAVVPVSENEIKPYPSKSIAPLASATPHDKIQIAF